MAQTQEYNSAQIELLAGAFPRRAENSFAWGNAISCYLGLPSLRAFYPFSSVDENGDAYDLSAQGRLMTNNNGVTFGVGSLQSYATFDGVNQYFSRPTEPGLEIYDELTLGAWVYSRNVGLKINVAIRKGLGNNIYPQISWSLNESYFLVSNGVAGAVASLASPVSAWYFICGRYRPAADVTFFLNTQKDTVATAFVAANATAHPVTIGATGVPSQLWDGHIANAFICAKAITDAQINAIYWLTRPLFYGS